MLRIRLKIGGFDWCPDIVDHLSRCSVLSVIIVFRYLSQELMARVLSIVKEWDTVMWWNFTCW